MNKLDHVDDNILPELSTKEIIDLHKQRLASADAVYGMLVMRAFYHDQTLKQNDKLVRLLRSSQKWLDLCVTDKEPDTQQELASLQDRITEALREHDEG